MAPEKAPAYQWYPKDYDTDEAVKLMTYEQEGIYRRLLDHQGLHGSLPSDAKEIAMLVPKVSLRRFLRLWPRLARKFELVDGRLINRKLERVKAATAEYRAGKSTNGKLGAEKRWQINSRDHSELIADALANTWPATATASSSTSASPLSLSGELSARAGRLREELYPAWYAKFRHGARLRLMASTLEFQDAVTLVQTWDDARIEQLAHVFLTTDDTWISGTDRGFRIFASKASWCDDRLRQVEISA